MGRQLIMCSMALVLDLNNNSKSVKIYWFENLLRLGKRKLKKYEHF